MGLQSTYEELKPCLNTRSRNLMKLFTVYLRGIETRCTDFKVAQPVLVYSLPTRN